MAHPIKNVTNQQVLDALKEQGYTFPPDFDMGGAQNGEFKRRIQQYIDSTNQDERPDHIDTSTNIFNSGVKTAKDLVLADRAADPADRLVQRLKAFGAKDEDVSKIVAGAWKLSGDKPYNEQQLAQSASTVLGVSHPGYLSASRGIQGAPVPPPPAPSAPPAAEVTGPPASVHYAQQRGGEKAPAAKPPAAMPAGQVVTPKAPSKADPSTGTLGDGSLDPKASPDQIKAYISKNYGHEAFLYNNPEIYPLIQEAAKKGYDENWLQGKVSQTNYWQHTSLTNRAWDEQKSTDPAEAGRRVKAEADSIRQWGAKFGLQLDEGRLNEIAEQSIRLGWDATQKHQALSAEIHYSPGAGKVDPQVVTDLKKKAGDYFVPMSDGTLNDWAQHVAAADGNMEGFDGYLIQQAKSLFPTLAGALDRGTTVKMFADPYAQIAAKTLEIPQDQIDFTDPKWMKALVNPDPKTGDRTFMGMADWQNELKKNPIYGWDKTQNARGEAADLAQQIIHRFGGGV